MLANLLKKGIDVIFKGNGYFIYDKTPSKMSIARVKMTKNRMSLLSMNYER